VFPDIEEAWRLVEASPEEREACELAAEVAFGEAGLGIVERIAQRLDLEPGLELMAVAKELGMSPRSLQRRLSEEGFKFAELREQARLRRSVVLVESGAKVETIAREVGFASTSHFIQWFRRQTGQTPGERRATPKG
jgi:AraC-like DNA-binding protein